MIKLYKSKDYLIFVIPAVLLFTFVHVLPFFSGFYLSLTDWNGVRGNLKWVGMSNFVKAFNDLSFRNSIWINIKFVLFSSVMINLFGFLLAHLVTQKIRGKYLLRTFYFMPNLLGGIILGFLWQFIFTEIFSSLGSVLNIKFLEGWLSDPVTGFWGLIILYSWKMSGYIMVVYIASLENIPSELLDAGNIDGANAFQKIIHIIFPLTAPAFTVSLFLIISQSFKLFDPNLTLTGGGPYRSTEMMALNIYNTAFTFFEMGAAQAKALIFFLFVSSIGIVQVYITGKREIES